MTGQYLGGRPIMLSYAFKRDGQKGERHGSAAERRLADLGKKNNVLVTGFLPPSELATLASMPPIPLPTGFTQAAGTGGTPAPTGVVPPPAAPGQYAPPPAGPPGFAASSAPPPGMPPPPGFNQFGR